MTGRTHVSDRARRARISAIKEMSILGAKVPDAASLAWGLPSFPTPEPIRTAAARALAEDPRAGMYALPAGLPELRRAVAAEHRRRTGIEIDPERRVTITAGNMQGLDTLFQVLVDPGDEVIVTDPGFVSHIQQIRFFGGVPVYWRMDEAAGWQPDPAELPGLVTERTKAIVIVTPSNPTGRILTEATLRAVAEVALARDLIVIVDDPYRHFTYENRARFFDLAGLPDLADNLAYLFTFSKAYAMSGWRVGYAVLPEALVDEVVKVHDKTMICAPRISQIAALAGLEGPPDHLAEFERILGRRRDLICERLDRLASVFAYVRPEGAYYVFPRLLDTADDVGFAHRLLDAAHVTVTPGSAFGPSGAGHVRMAYCVGEDVLNTAFDRLDAHFGA